MTVRPVCPRRRRSWSGSAAATATRSGSPWRWPLRLAVILLVTGITMADDPRALAGLHRRPGAARPVQVELFARGDGAIIDLVDLTLVIPLLFGLFWGRPCWAKESRTALPTRLDPGAGRAKHVVNLTWSLLAAAVWGAALAALPRWRCTWRTRRTSRRRA